MTEKELKDVFKWLETNMNKQNLFYFKLTDGNQISAYWKVDNKPAATFYIKRIIKILKEE